jgi:hypothetical protein
MRPLHDLPRESARAVRGLFFDIDDTLTTDGKLLPHAFAALWRAHDAGLTCVAITGRPAGWCDHIARMWPVAGVVGENGGFYFHMSDGKLRKRFWQDDTERRASRARLEAIRDEILRRFPQAAIASDQPYRELDLAIDFCEDVPPMSLDDAHAIAEVFRAHGAVAKVSSIHVNGWFGAWDKLSMCRVFLAETQRIDLDAERDRFVFAGDSPNDEPMFAFFPLGVGVANVRRFASCMASPPRFVTDGEAGDGFCELVDALVRARS